MNLQRPLYGMKKSIHFH